jgi:hypothetical protein
MIAIDPGASGGIVQDGTAQTPFTFAMPKTDRDVKDALAPRIDLTKGGDLNLVAYLEDLVKFTGRNMPSSSMAVYASNWGFIKGVLTTYGYRIVIVPPKVWQKALGLGSAKDLTKTQWKNKLKQKAQELYPKTKVTLATADALLIYEAARRGLLG